MLRTQATAFIHWKLECTMDRLKLQARAAISQVELDKEALLEQKEQGERSADAALNATQQRMSQQQMDLMQHAKVAATAAVEQVESKRREEVTALLLLP